MFASACDPLLEDLHTDLLSIIHIFVSYGMNSCSSVTLKEEETKVVVLDANLLILLSLPQNLTHSIRVGL